MNKKNYIIRQAEFRDAELIFELIKSYPEELLQRPISDIVQNIDRFIVCENHGNLTGAVAWQILPEIGAPRKPSVEIKSLAVKKQEHGKGLGRELVLSAIERIRELQPRQIISLTFHPDFFVKLGFKETPKEKLMHKIYAGCINCTKYHSPFTCPEIAMTLDL